MREPKNHLEILIVLAHVTPPSTGNGVVGTMALMILCALGENCTRDSRYPFLVPACAGLVPGSTISVGQGFSHYPQQLGG